MKKYLLILPILFILLCPNIGLTANIFCPNCQTATGDCIAACINQGTNATNICLCEDGVTFSIDNATQCNDACELRKQQAAQAQLQQENPIFCDCSQTEGVQKSECADPCKTYVNQKICLCGINDTTPKTVKDETECAAHCSGQPTTPAQTLTTPTLPTTTTTQEPPRLSVPGMLQIVQLSKFEVPADGDTGKLISVPWISEYIIGIYKYSLGFASVMAVIVVMIAGVLYLTSAGNPERIGQAKNYLIGAVAGLTILASSYIVLNLISPQLTQLGSVEIQAIDPLELEINESFDEHSSASASPSPEGLSLGSAQTAKTDCNVTPSQPSGAADSTLLGKEYLDCNSTKERELSAITHIILHDGDTAEKNVRRWRNTCEKGGPCIASHYTINRNGAIVQTLDEKKVGHHVSGNNDMSIGIDLAAKPNAFWRWGRIYTCIEGCKKGYYMHKGQKRKKTGCETKEKAIEECTPTFTEAQYKSLNKLLKSIVTRTSVSFDDQHIVAHCEMGHSDPRNFNWGKIGLSTDPHKTSSPRAATECRFSPEFADKVKETANKVFGP